MSPRTEVAEFLTTELPNYRVLPYFRVLDGSEGITLMVATNSIKRERSQWIANVTVYVATGHQDPALAEDVLDEAVAELLAVLNTKQDAVDLEAERLVIQDTLNAYTVSLSLPLKESA